MAGVNVQFDEEDMDKMATRLLQKMQELIASPENPGGFLVVPVQLKVKQVADILQIALPRAYEMLNAGEDPIPSMRLGEETIRVDPRALDRWLDRHPNVAAARREPDGSMARERPA